MQEINQFYLHKQIDGNIPQVTAIPMASINKAGNITIHQPLESKSISSLMSAYIPTINQIKVAIILIFCV